VNHDPIIRVAETLLGSLGSGASPEDIALLFSPDVEWEVAGDVGALPWIGRKKGREVAADFVRNSRDLIEPLRFDVQDILANDDRAVIIGELASRVKCNQKTIETAFTIVLTVSDGQITRFQMLEDSFAVSQAAR
jgi:hypothetical protein